MAFGHPPLFKGVMGVGTHYVGIPKRGYNAAQGIQIAWKDATSDATVTLEVTNFPPDDAPTETAGQPWHWFDTGEAITGPAGAAAGNSWVPLENVRALRARLVFVVNATSDLEIRDDPTASAQ